MRTDRFGELTVRLSGGSDREGGGDGPLVVLLHGFGAPGDDLVPLGRVMDVPEGTRFAFPAAPHRLEMGIPLGDQRMWWMIDMARLEEAMATGKIRDMSEETPDGLPSARGQIRAMLDAMLPALSADPARTVLGGFSQGAMLALDVALHDPRPFAGLALMSGTLLSRSEWTELLPARRGLPVFQSHGRLDPLLDFGIAERLHALLVEAGLDATFVAFRGVHEIPPPVLSGLEAFLKRVLA
jgi:phospholipase/carboxylesterase